MASKSSTAQDEEATTEEVPRSIVIYTEEEINTFNRDILFFFYFVLFYFSVLVYVQLAFLFSVLLLLVQHLLASHFVADKLLMMF